MKKLILVTALLALTSCTTRTSAGQCVGLADTKVPGLKYELSYWNIFMAALFSETIIIPIIVVAKHLECPR